MLRCTQKRMVCAGINTGWWRVSSEERGRAVGRNRRAAGLRKRPRTRRLHTPHDRAPRCGNSTVQHLLLSAIVGQTVGMVSCSRHGQPAVMSMLDPNAPMTAASPNRVEDTADSLSPSLLQWSIVPILLYRHFLSLWLSSFMYSSSKSLSLSSLSSWSWRQGEIEMVMDVRLRSGIKEFLIKWRGGGMASWEPETNLDWLYANHICCRSYKIRHAGGHRACSRPIGR